METVVWRTQSSVVDRMEPTVRDHTVEMVDREASVVRVEKISPLSPSWHILEDVQFGGGGCPDDFRP